MAKPIKETPVLKDADAKIFLDQKVQAESHRLDAPAREKIKSNFEKLNSISQF